MEKIGKSFSNAGQVFSHMTVAWCEELECGHRRGEEIPHWLEEKKIGVSTLPRYVIREKVAIHLGKNCFHSLRNFMQFIKACLLCRHNATDTP